MRIKDIEPEEDGEPKRSFSGFHEALRKTLDFQELLSNNAAVKEVLSAEEHAQVHALITLLASRLSGQRWSYFSEWKQIQLLNSAISYSVRKLSERPASLQADDNWIPCVREESDSYRTERVGSCEERGDGHSIIRETIGNLGPRRASWNYRLSSDFTTEP